jgi:hypothetical protein
MDEKGDNPIPAIAEILSVHIPRITHRGEEIRNMKCVGRRNHSFGHAMAATQNEIVAFEAEPFDCHGKQGEIGSIILFRKREILDEGRLDGPLLNLR